MLYPRNEGPMDKDLFERPTSEYRGAPFWAWNTKLEDGELCRQIDMLREMGMGGFHMHSRSGMATDYLSDEFMTRVKTCVGKARSEGMLAWLYDEDRWPSGAAGGLVTRDDRWRARWLTVSRDKDKDALLEDASGAIPGGCRKRAAAYQVVLDGAAMASCRSIAWDEPVAKGFGVYVYQEVMGDDPWYNNQAYLDLLNPRAVAEFIRVTHERYRETVGDAFGETVPAIFTDEPMYFSMGTLGYAEDPEDIRLAWTEDFAETFRAASGMDFFSRLPELLWDRPGGAPSEFRYQYHRHVALRFSEAFARQIGAWCDAQGIALTGHMMAESTLDSQVMFIGDAMQSLRWFGLPGVDMLCDWREWTTVKQAQSVANQLGKPGVLSELYGVTGWDADFRLYKLQGDWQAALGVTVRVHHLTWLSMQGEAKRDYPASIGDQSPWWKEYPYIEDHFARLNTALTRGKNAARIAVVHPMESMWLAYGARETTAETRARLEDSFQQVTSDLLRGALDFDYINEASLPELCPQSGVPLAVGNMAYDAVVVPFTLTLRSSTLERLETFSEAGGLLVFAGDPAACVDAVPSRRAVELCGRSVRADSGASLLAALEPARTVEIRGEDGARTRGYLHQLREDGTDRWLLICQADVPKNHDVPSPQRLRVKVRGLWDAQVYDTVTGAIARAHTEHIGGGTELSPCLDLHDSILYRLIPAASSAEVRPATGSTETEFKREIRWRGAVPVLLDEPNALLLDQAEWRLDGDEPWNPPEEILIIDNKVREELGYPLRMSSLAQPWVFPDATAEHTLWLRFTVESRVSVAAPRLALEQAAQSTVLFDGKPVRPAVNGWYVDRAIQTVALPGITPGVHELIVGVPITLRAGAEWMYLLGDFGVEVMGTKRMLTEAVCSLGFGSITGQGLPYYGGIVTYKLTADLPGGKARLIVPQYRGGAVALDVDGKRVANLSFAPYAAELDLAPGEHRFDVVLYGNRFNAFGAVHNANDTDLWQGPNAWRTQGSLFEYEYRLRKLGVLVSPILRY